MCRSEFSMTVPPRVSVPYYGETIFANTFEQVESAILYNQNSTIPSAVAEQRSSLQPSVWKNFSCWPRGRFVTLACQKRLITWNALLHSEKLPHEVLLCELIVSFPQNLAMVTMWVDRAGNGELLLFCSFFFGPALSQFGVWWFYGYMV